MNELKPYFKSNGLVPSKNNPFKEDIEAFQKKLKQTNRTDVQTEEITLCVKRTYFPGSYTKLYHNKELLNSLSCEACKVFIHIALNMNYEAETIELKCEDVGMDRRKTSRAIKELLDKRILCKEKKITYWVNVTLLIIGNINKHPKQSIVEEDEVLYSTS